MPSSRRSQGTNLVAINPPMPINDLHIYPGTGLVFLANETSPMTGYYVPQLGPAPKWCRFLDNMTEEMEDDQVTTIYDDYKFVDRAELDECVPSPSFLVLLGSGPSTDSSPLARSLNLTHLIGTDTLKPYMHGYFVDLRLYTKARAIANPFQYAEHRDQLVRDKLAAEHESRIRGAKKAAGSSGGAGAGGVKVNKALAKKLRTEEERQRKREAGELSDDYDEGSKRRKKKSAAAGADAPSLLKDDRFGDLFTNPDFEIDEESREFQLLNPSTKPRQHQASDDDEDEDDEVEQNSSEDDEASNSDSSAEGGASLSLFPSAPLLHPVADSCTSSARRARLRLPAPPDRPAKTARQGDPPLLVVRLHRRSLSPSPGTRRRRRLGRRHALGGALEAARVDGRARDAVVRAAHARGGGGRRRRRCDQAPTSGRRRGRRRRGGRPRGGRHHPGLGGRRHGDVVHPVGVVGQVVVGRGRPEEARADGQARQGQGRQEEVRRGARAARGRAGGRGRATCARGRGGERAQPDAQAGEERESEQDEALVEPALLRSRSATRALALGPLAAS